MTTFQTILEHIKHYQTIIIHRHQNPDPDALGSQAGLKEIIRHNFPDKKVLITGFDEPSLAWISLMDQVSDDDYKEALVIVTDTAIAPALMMSATQWALASLKLIITLTMMSMVISPTLTPRPQVLVRLLLNLPLAKAWL